MIKENVKAKTHRQTWVSELPWPTLNFDVYVFLLRFNRKMFFFQSRDGKVKFHHCCSLVQKSTIAPHWKQASDSHAGRVFSRCFGLY